jgi:hypothetical protein
MSLRQTLKLAKAFAIAKAIEEYLRKNPERG